MRWTTFTVWRVLWLIPILLFQSAAPAQTNRPLLGRVGQQAPAGAKFEVAPSGENLQAPRNRERAYYHATSRIARNRLFPLTRPPLQFANAWGWITGDAAEYMVKSFRLLGLNCVATSADMEKYEKLYGWGSAGAQYQPPTILPCDAADAARRFGDYYRDYFQTGEGKTKFASPGLLSFQLSDEPRQIEARGPEAEAGFRRWLAGQGLQPEFFGKKKWEEVALLAGGPKTPEEQRRYYWSRRYQGMLTPLMFALAADAFCRESPSRTVKPFVGLSGHALYGTPDVPGNRMPLDMFQLAQYTNVMPGISDWMVEAPGGWFWDSHQAVAYSVAAFNGGARRYGADFGQPPLSFPMMHCVYPSLCRAYTQLGNQCKLISFYNYGPDYIGAAGAWSGSENCRYAVHHICNQASLADDILGPGTMRPSRVALLYSLAAEYRWPQLTFPDKRATFLALAHEFFQPELVNEDQVAAGALAHYDALYVLDPWVAGAAQQAIEKWTRGGGLLWACADAASKNEYDEGCDLLERLGLQRAPAAADLAGNALQVAPAPEQETFTPHAVPAQGRPRTVTCAGARVRATYGDGVPAWLEKTAGKGKLVYIGHRAGLNYALGAGRWKDECIWPDDGRVDLVGQCLREAGIAREMIISDPARPGRPLQWIQAVPLSTASGTVIPLYNVHRSYPKPRSDLVIRLREPKPPVSVEWVWAGELKLAAIPFTHQDGWLTTTLPDLPYDGTLLVVRRTPAPPDDRLDKMRQAAEAHLASSDWQAVSAGAWFAGFFPEWKLGAKLAPGLRHSHWAVRRSAAEALGRLGERGAAVELRQAVERETDAHALADEIAALALLGQADVPALCQALQASADPFWKAESARITALKPVPAK